MKRIVFNIMLFIILILISSNVLAVTSLSCKVSSSEKDAKGGQEVKINLIFDQYQEIDTGINSYKATLEYDKEIFEQVKQDDFLCLNNWEQLQYNKETGELVAIKRAGSKTTEDVVQVNFKVKENAKPQETEIKITDIVTSEGKQDLFVQEANAKINIIKEQLDKPINPEQPDSNNTNKPGNISNNEKYTGITSQNQNSNRNEDNTISIKRLPKSGSNQIRNAITLLSILILLIVAYISKKKEKEINKKISKKTKIIITTLIVSIVSLQTMVTIYAAVSDFISKGELNDDGEINYEDVNLLELHLIHKKELPENKLQNADINNDGELTVTDLTLLVQKIEKTINYEVQISDAELENYYPNQKEEITLKFDAYVSNEANIKTVIINEQQYEVTKIEGTNQYTFKTNTGDVSGIKEYHFTEVLLNNEKTIKVDYILKIDVLKEKPRIENYITAENIDEQKIDISFDLVDKDNSITSAKLEIINEAEELIQEEELTKGENRIEVEIQEGKKYKVYFMLISDLDTNQLDQEKDHVIREQIVKELQMTIDYDLKITNVTTKKEDQITNTFERNQPIQIAFGSTNNTKNEPTQIKVNGKQYEVVKKDNQYIATIDGITELGEKKIIIEEIILNNGKKFTLENNNEVTVKIIKQKPIIEELTTEENVEQNNMKVDFTLKDEDKTIKNASIVILDEEGNQIERQELSNEEIERGGKIEKTLTTKITSKYKIKIIATYNQTGVETENIIDSILFEQEIKAKPRATIKQVTCNKDYVEKGGNITITYDIETNKTEQISKICINNTNCQVTKLDNGKYEVTLTANERSGIQELVTTKIIYSDNTIADVNQTIKVDILKDKPNIENFIQQDNIEQSQVTLNFDLIDQDNSFINGKAVLIKQEDTSVKQEKEIQVGENNITFDIENAKLYTLQIKVTYDRDTNTLEDKPIEDNRIADEILQTNEIQLLSDYELQISNINTYKQSTESKYFEKEEAITVKFESTNISKFVPVKVVINGKQYNLTKTENIYEVTIDSYTQSGPKDIVIEKIILDNTKELEITQDNQAKIEILKSKPKVTKFSYTERDDNTVTVTFQIDDQEETVTGGEIIITSEGETPIKTQAITRGENTITFEKTESETYFAKILASYDLDTNTIETGKNEVQNEKLLEQEINLGDRLIEMKDISSIGLYKQNADNVDKIVNINITELANLENYIVKVDMQNARSFYAPIKEYRIEGNKLKLVLEYNKIVQYEGEQKRNQLEVEYGEVENGAAINMDLQTLMQKIKEDPTGTYKMTVDVDAKSINVGTTVIPEEFTGKIDFGGHKIKNLSVPLFNKLNGATIENLIIENSATTAQGMLANTISASTVRNVHLKKVTVTAPNINGTGSLAGLVNQNSLIEGCSATNVEVGTAKRTGGFIGNMNGSTVRNCYIQGTVSTNNDGSGGFIGETPSGCTVENVYSNVQTNFGSGTNAGIVGWSQNVIMKNALSISHNKIDGAGYRVVGSGLNRNSSNIYELETSNMVSQASHNAINTVTEAELKTKQFYIEKLKWDETIWNFDKVEEGQYPTLRNDDPSNKQIEQPSNTNIYIPDYSRVKKLSNYKQEKEIAYYNMYRLMPFYDAKYYVEDGNKFEVDHILNTKIISHIFAYDENGKMISALSQEQKDKIKSIKILFSDNETISYAVEYKDNTEQIVNYVINDLEVDYTYDKYLVNTQSNTYKHIVNQVKAYDFMNNLAILVEGNEVRTTIENYANVQANAEDFALKLLANNDTYTISTSNTVVDKKVMKDLTTDKTLEKLTYVYNHYSRYYDIEIGGIKMSDIIFFDANVFSNELNAIKITNMFINADASARSTNRIASYYNTYIRPSTGLQYMDFLEFFIKNLAEDKYREDPESWIIDNFDGIIYEEAAPRYPNMRYRVWDHFKHGDQNALVLFLSYHGNELYLLGIPTALLTGNIGLSDYVRKYPNIEDRINLLKTFASLAVPFYDSVAGVVEGTQGHTNISNFTQFSYDSTYGRNWSQEENIDPAFKAFNEPMNLWITKPAGSAAYANGTNMYWMAHHALSDFVVYSHEAIHNQDGRIFLQGTGRRRGAGAEHFTDNFLTQSGGYSGYGVVPNYSYTRPITSTVTNNICKDRINTRDKIESYYKGMYDTFAYLDYIEAQAFLQLTPGEQCRIAQAIEGQAYVWKTEEEFRQMNLKTIEDIWDNHLVIIRGNKAYTTGSMWYIVENEAVGASGKAFFVLNAYQFLADFGYEGYVSYAGNRYGSKTDAEIIQTLTNDETMTWKKYQLNRYEKVKEKLDRVPHINTNEAIKTTLKAMKLDVEHNVPIDLNSYASTYREAMYGYLKRITNDFETSIYDVAQNIIHINNAQELVAKINEHPEANIILDKDIDFTGYNIEESSQSIISTFVGTLDGNGHKITGLTKPLFSTMVFTRIKNLIIENANVAVNYNKAGTLSKTIDFSILENITLNHVTMTGTSTIGGIAGTINRSTIKNITYQDANVSSSNNSNEIGGLFGVATYCSIENVHGINTTISGNNNVAGIVGNANYIYKIEGCSFKGTVTGRSNNVGGVFGYIQNSRIENCYTLGTITGRSYVGGLVGNVSATKIDKTFSNASVKGTILAGTGGLVGNVANASEIRKITNSIALGRVNNGYKFDANSTKEIIEGYFSNNYELVEAMGHSTLERQNIDFSNKITETNLANINNEFYINTLNWDNNIWDLKNVNTGGLPKLRNLDTNDEKNIIQKTEISSVEEFLKINENPDAIYKITKDIDFTSFIPAEGADAVITQIFTGKLEGNGHIISNLNNASLFTHFRGIVQDLEIRDFTNQRNANFVTAFTKESYTASFKNMTFENITLSGGNNVAVVTGMDGRENANSIFDKITVKNANVTATGVYASAFIGRKYGGKVTNCYVQGALQFTATECGGIIGAVHQAIQIENVISNVNINRPRSTDNRNNNGGFVGNIYETPSIKNCISIGDMTGFTQNGIEINVYKFAGCTQENIKSYFTNCYELKTATGTSSITANTENNLKEATFANLRNKNFYKDNLNFDETIWDLDSVVVDGYPELKK